MCVFDKLTCAIKDISQICFISFIENRTFQCSCFIRNEKITFHKNEFDFIGPP